MKSNFLFYFICGLLIAVIFVVVLEEPIKDSDQADSNSAFTTGLTKKGKIDLVSKLDPTYITPMVENLFKDALRKNMIGEKINEFTLKGLQDYVSEISLIDMNNDEIVDPVFVIPDGDGDSFHYMIRVPNWSLVKSLPIGSGESFSKEMYKIATNNFIEICRVSILPKYNAQKNFEGFDIQLQPNQNLYSEHKSFYLNTFNITLPEGVSPKSLCRPPVWWTDSYFWSSGGIYSRPFDTRTIRQVTASRSNYMAINNVVPINKTSNTALLKPDGKPLEVVYEMKKSDEISEALASFKSQAKKASRKADSALARNGSGAKNKKKPQPYWASVGRFRD